MKIRLRENGSLVIDLPEQTPFWLDGQQQVLERPKLALCRCGASKRKPFCDGTHRQTGFTAEPGAVEWNMP